MRQDHWLPGFNFNVEEWFEGDRYETLAICRSLELAPLLSTRRPLHDVVKRRPEGDW